MRRCYGAALAALLTTAVACSEGTQPEPTEEVCVMSDAAASREDLTEQEADQRYLALVTAFQQDSAPGLSLFLETWRRDIAPVSCEVFESKPEREKETYRLYRAYFDPFNLAKYGQNEWGVEFNRGYRYVVVPEVVGAALEGDEEPYYDWVDYHGFRPALYFEDTTPLYLTERYREILERFLGPGPGPDTPWERVAFLRTQFPFRSGHWGGWVFTTAPEVFSVRYQPDLRAARVCFRIIYEGGFSHMLKIDDEWVMTESDITWIE